MAEKGLFIEQLQSGGVATLQALVKVKELRPKRNGGFYLRLLLGDRTGELEAKVWDNPQETGGLFEQDDIVKVRGAIETYNDKPQLIVQRIRRCESKEFEEADFCPVSKYDPDVMLNKLYGFAASVVDPCVRGLLQSMLDDPEITEPLKVAPAAMRLHHPCRGGLLEHLVSICEAAEILVQKYSRLNRDWLIAGAILHDLGKIGELGTSRRLGYTTRGQLLGHIGIGLEILDKHWVRFPNFSLEVKTILQHLIISHHGEVGKGALRAPMFPEAIALHYLDEIDARLEQAWRTIDQTPASEAWTAYVPSLQRQLYCGPSREGSATVPKAVEMST